MQLWYLKNTHPSLLIFPQCMECAIPVVSHNLMREGSVIVVIGISLAAVFIGRALYSVNMLIRLKRNEHFIPLTPFALDLPAQEVTFPSLHGTHRVRGIYYRPTQCHNHDSGQPRLSRCA